MAGPAKADDRGGPRPAAGPADGDGPDRRRAGRAADAPAPRGDWRHPGKEVAPGFLSILDDRPAQRPGPEARRATTGRRAALARWLTGSDNPLTARVMVNRLWQGHFGRGIVATPSDFGIQGEPPTHPELLDWLATEFVARGWSLKAMHRLMVTVGGVPASRRDTPRAR